MSIETSIKAIELARLEGYHRGKLVGYMIGFAVAALAIVVIAILEFI